MPSLLRSILAFFARLFAAFGSLYNFQRNTMKVDNTALSAQIDATAVVITGLLDKVKAAVNDAATIADLQAQLSAANDGHGATQVALDAANAALADANAMIASLTADLAASQQESADLAVKLEAVKNLATV